VDDLKVIRYPQQNNTIYRWQQASNNTRYKTLGFKWLFKRSATNQVRCIWIGKESAIPNDFIPPTIISS